MEDTNTQTTGVVTTQDGVESKPETKTENMIPKHRFDEVYGQMKTLQEQLAAIQAEKAEGERQELEKTQQFKTLYEQQKAEYEKLQALSTQYQTSATQYETVMNSMLETKLKAVPAEMQELIPAGLSVTEKLDWITKAEHKGLFGAKQTTNVPIGQPMNVPHATPDYSKMSATELLHLAYSTKK